MLKELIIYLTGLPHTQGNQGIFKLQKISGKFWDLKNLRKIFFGFRMRFS